MELNIYETSWGSRREVRSKQHSHQFFGATLFSPTFGMTPKILSTTLDFEVPQPCCMIDFRMISLWRPKEHGKSWKILCVTYTLSTHILCKLILTIISNHFIVACFYCCCQRARWRRCLYDVTIQLITWPSRAIVLKSYFQYKSKNWL